MTETCRKPKQCPAPDEQEPRFRQLEPSLLQRLELAGSSAQQTRDAAVDENIKLFCEQVVKSDDLPPLGDGGDGNFRHAQANGSGRSLERLR